jgi:hypothetical protein
MRYIDFSLRSRVTADCRLKDIWFLLPLYGQLETNVIAKPCVIYFEFGQDHTPPCLRLSDSIQQDRS